MSFYVECRTNLDLELGEKWPTQLEQVPNVGDEIQSAYVHRGVFQLRLAVTSVCWQQRTKRYSHSGEEYITWVPVIELHMTKTQKRLPCSKGEEYRGCLTAFYEWYAPAVGSHISAFAFI